MAVTSSSFGNLDLQLSPEAERMLERIFPPEALRRRAYLNPGDTSDAMLADAERCPCHACPQRAGCKAECDQFASYVATPFVRGGVAPPCAFCGTLVDRPPRKGQRSFCSRKCGERFRNRQVSLRRRE